jgi:phage gp46-like protein
MPGFDRKIDPISGDYVDAPGGEYAETASIQPQIYHQLNTQRARWWGDFEAGCDLYLVKQRGLSQGTVVFAKDTTKTALQGFVEAGQARDLSVEAVGSELGRLSVEIAITDTSTGERLEDIAPIGEE